MRDLVIAERERVAVTHSRLITRQPRLVEAAGGAATARRSWPPPRGWTTLETGSHSAGALFNLLLERWKDLLRSRA